MTMPDKIPFVLRITGARGAIGKCYVIKYYPGRGYFMSRFPKKSSVPPSEAMKRQRNLFGEAMAYAKWIFSNAQRKQAFLNTLPPKKRRNHPERWMVSYYMKASVQLREKIKAKMQRSKIKLKPSIINPLVNSFHKYQWAKLWEKPVVKMNTAYEANPTLMQSRLQYKLALISSPGP